MRRRGSKPMSGRLPLSAGMQLSQFRPMGFTTSSTARDAQASIAEGRASDAGVAAAKTARQRFIDQTDAKDGKSDLPKGAETARSC